MDSQVLDEIMEELSSTLQRIETQSAAVLEFMKGKGLANDDELAPYLERAALASSVRWRAVRVRVEYLAAGLGKDEEQAQGKQASKRQAKDNEAKAKQKALEQKNAKGRGEQGNASPTLSQRTRKGWGKSAREKQEETEPTNQNQAQGQTRQNQGDKSQTKNDKQNAA